jgi:hypothetical protein
MRHEKVPDGEISGDNIFIGFFGPISGVCDWRTRPGVSPVF